MPTKTPTPPKKQPTDEQIEEALQPLIKERTENFSVRLANAREFYKKHRLLVTAPKFPERYTAAYEGSKHDKSGKPITTFVSVDEPAEKAPTDASLRTELPKEAREIATYRAKLDESPSAAAVNDEHVTGIEILRQTALSQARFCMEYFEENASLVDAMLLRDLVSRFMSIDDFAGVLGELFADARLERRTPNKAA
jgi:hypothetical protein